MGRNWMRPGALMAIVLAGALASSACAAATQAASVGGSGGPRQASHAAARGAAGSHGSRPAHATVRQASHGSAQAAAPPGTVLVNQPASRVCLGKKFTVGVWFQQSGGSRAYRLSVYSPSHKRIFFRRGQAPSSHWAFWKIRAKQAGKYHTVYSAHWHSATAWSRYRVATRAHPC